MQIITNVDPYQAQLLNRFRRGSMLVPGETMLVLECAPAAYINYACNEAEKGREYQDIARFVCGTIRSHVALWFRSGDRRGAEFGGQGVGGFGWET
ncbi:MAG: hypothetical protein U0V48_18690 [Anaerolineales bacterium]